MEQSTAVWRRNTAEETERDLREIKRYDNALAVDYYNLNAADSDQVDQFLEEYIRHKKPDDFIVWDDEGPRYTRNYTTEIRTPDEEGMLFIEEQPEFRKLVDKALAKERFSDAEVEHIHAALGKENRISRLYRNGPELIEYWVQSFDESTVSSVVGLNRGTVYRWLVRLTQGSTKARICSAPDCDRLFMPDPKNIARQRYCSSTCRTRIGKRRERQRKAMSTA